MKQILEKILNDENLNSIWITGVGKDDVEFVDDDTMRFKGRVAFANATILNPLFFTKNISYAYSYSNNNKDGYIALVKVKDLKNINVLDLTNSKELASIFPSCADSPCFYEIFSKAEPYFGFNCGDIAQGKLRLRPMSFIIARLVISYRNQDKIGSFIEMYKAFEDLLLPYTGKKAEKNGIGSTITKCYPVIPPIILKKKKLELDLLIMNDDLKDVNFYDKRFTENEYTEIYNEYCEAVFKHCIVIDKDGKYVKDSTGKYILTKYKDMFPNDKRGNVNPNRPVSRDKTIGLSKDQKNINITLPEQLSAEDIKMVNLYLSITEELHKWYKNAVVNENTTLMKKFKDITNIINNNDGEKNKNASIKKKGSFSFEHGMAASYIDRLQYMFFYLISKHSNSYDGCYSPEVLGSKSKGKNIDSVDETILIWNSLNLLLIDVVKYKNFEDIKSKIDAASATDDKESPYYFKGKKYTDNDIRLIFDEAKKSKLYDVNGNNELSIEIKSAESSRTLLPEKLEEKIEEIINNKDLSDELKKNKLKLLRSSINAAISYRKTAKKDQQSINNLEKTKKYITDILRKKYNIRNRIDYTKKEDLIRLAIKIKFDKSKTLDQKIDDIKKLIRKIDVVRYYARHPDIEAPFKLKTIDVSVEAYPYILNIKNELQLEKSLINLGEKIKTLLNNKNIDNKKKVESAYDEVKEYLDMIEKTNLSDIDTIESYKYKSDDIMQKALLELSSFDDYNDKNAKYIRDIDEISDSNDTIELKIDRLIKYYTRIRQHKTEAKQKKDFEEVEKTQNTIEYLKKKRNELLASMQKNESSINILDEIIYKWEKLYV